MDIKISPKSVQQITKTVYDAVVEEVALSVSAAVKDSLRDLENRLQNLIRSEVEHRVKTITTSYEVKIMQIREDYLKSLEHMVKSMPVPVVTVEQPRIDVTIPDSAIQVRVEQELKQKPRKTKVTKSVVYGPTGRPEKIEEETIESTDEQTPLDLESELTNG